MEEGVKNWRGLVGRIRARSVVPVGTHNSRHTVQLYVDDRSGDGRSRPGEYTMEVNSLRWTGFPLLHLHQLIETSGYKLYTYVAQIRCKRCGVHTYPLLLVGFGPPIVIAYISRDILFIDLAVYIGSITM